MQGNTGPYLQYAVARINSIFRKLPEGAGFKHPRDPWARNPARKGLGPKAPLFPLALSQTLRELKPHFLCTYLYELATDFSSFYNHDKVMVEDRPTQGLRMLLCLRTKTFPLLGLDILGIKPWKKCERSLKTSQYFRYSIIRASELKIFHF